MAATSAVGLHAEDRRGRRRRLASHLRRTAPVLRAHRSAIRGLRPGRRPGLPRRRRSPAAPAPHRTRRAQGRSGPCPARMALVAGGQRDPVGTVVGPAPVRPTCDMPPRVQRGRQGLHRSDPLAGVHGGRRPARHRGVRRGDPHAMRAGLATGAEWVDEEGRAHFQAADVVLLAANGIGTPRLLLASASSGAPGGLANSSGLVGTRLMVHPLALVKGLFRQDLESWRGHAGGSIVSYEFYASDERRGFVGGAKWAMAPTGGPLRAALANGGAWGEEHHRHVRDRFGCSAHWGLVCEDLPNPENRVDLSPTLTDRAGLAAPRITYRIDDNTRALCEWHIDKARESLVEAGAWHTEVEFRYPPNGHFMGTARMGDDPRPFGRRPLVHGPRRAEPGHHRRQHVRHLRGREPHQLHLRAGPAGGGPSDRPPGGRAHSRAPARRCGFGDPGHPGSGRPGSPARRSARHPRPPAGRHGNGRRRRPPPAGPDRPGPDPGRGRHALGRRGGRVRRPSRPGGDCRALPRRRAHRGARHRHRRGGHRLLAGRALADATRQAYGSLVLAVAGAYYLDPGVRRRLGYEGQVPQPVRPDAFPEYVDEGLLDATLSNWAPESGGVRTASPPRPGSG